MSIHTPMISIKKILSICLLTYLWISFKNAVSPFWESMTLIGRNYGGDSASTNIILQMRSEASEG